MELNKHLLEVMKRISHLDNFREELIDKRVPETVKREILKEVLDG